jgi:hypothetical protein
VRLKTPPRKKYCYETSRRSQGPPRAVEPIMMMMMMMIIRRYTGESGCDVILGTTMTDTCLDVLKKKDIKITIMTIVQMAETELYSDER